MANIKISQLPEFSGSPAETWIVLNNSGETTTSKILREDFLSGKGGVIFTTTGDTDTTAFTNWSTPTYINATGGKNVLINVDTLRMDDYFSGNTIIGTSHYLRSDGTVSDGTQNAFVVGSGNFLRGSQTNPIVMGQNHQYDRGGNNFFIIGGSSNVLSNISGNAGGILGGQNNTCYGGNFQNSVMIGGNANQCQSGVQDVGMFVSSNSTITSSSYNSVMVGGTAHQMTNAGHGVMAGGYANSLSNGYCAFVSGRGNTFTGTYQDCEGGMYSTWNGVSNQAGKATMMGAGNNNRLETTSDYAVLLGGEGNTMTTAPNSFMAGSNSSVISASTNSAVISSTFTGIDTKDRAVMIGTSNENALYSATTHVQNIHTFNTETFDVVAGGNVGGSIDVDCSAGTIYTFTLTADTTPNFTNIKVGQRFIFIVYNNGTWTVPTATVNSAAGTVFAKNGTINPSNNGYTKYTATYDGTYMFLDEELGFSAV